MFRAWAPAVLLNHWAQLPPAGRIETEPQVQTPASAEPAPVTDPVCGMTVDPATAEHRGTVYFCSAGCAAAYDAEPGRPLRDKVPSGGMSS